MSKKGKKDKKNKKIVLCRKLKLTILGDEQTRNEQYKLIRDEQYQQYKALNLCMDLYQANHTLRKYEFKLEVDSRKELNDSIPKKEKLIEKILTLEKQIILLEEKGKLDEKDEEKLEQKKSSLNKKNDELSVLEEKILKLKNNMKNSIEYQASLSEKMQEKYIDNIHTVVQNQVNLNYKDTLSLVTQKVKKDFEIALDNGLKEGERKSTSYKRDFPLMTKGRELKFKYRDENSDDIIIKWVKGITFKVILSNKKNNDKELRHTLHKIINNEVKICDSSLQFDNKNNLILNLAMEMKVERGFTPIEGRVMGVDLGMKIPAIASFNNMNGFKKFGSIDDFLRVRKQIQARRRKLQIALTTVNGGHGRDKKLQALDRFSKSEKNFVNTYNHTISRQIIEYAKANKCGVINLEFLSLADQEKDLFLTMSENKIKQSRFIKRNWSYFDLQTKIMDKANREGIEVLLIDPYHTSQTCSKCGHYEAGQRTSQAHFKCKSCGYEVNADFNASQNIAKSTKYIDKKEDSQFFKNKKSKAS